MFGHAIKTVYRATLLLATAVLAVGLAGAPRASAGTEQALVGAWSGPPTIGETGACGSGSGLFAFSPNGTYRYVALYDGCTSVMVDGHYELQADGTVLQLSMDECADPCPQGPSTLTTSLGVIDADNIVLDGRYTYKRQLS
jgi:hypothetical protein